MSLETELNCVGYYGFGGGWKLAKEGNSHGHQETYCGSCSLAETCWNKHRDRVRQMVPDLMAEMDARVAAGEQGPELVARWFKDFQCATPDIAVMAGNIEDGCYAASTGKVKDRKEGTLPYPFLII